MIVTFSDVTPRQLAPGVSARILHGAGLTVMRAELEAGARVPAHAHPHEQSTTVLAGRLRLTIAGLPAVLEPGMTAVIPGGVEHAATAETTCLVLDVFTPVREDLRAPAAAGG